MNSVHSEELGVTINGNTITWHDMSELDMLIKIQELSPSQFSGVGTDFTMIMGEREHREFAGLIHRANTENKLKKKLDTNGKGPDNDGPKPTNPRGSGGEVFTPEFVQAVAA